jgi:hypothetical protein
MLTATEVSYKVSTLEQIKIEECNTHVGKRVHAKKVFFRIIEAGEA